MSISNVKKVYSEMTMIESNSDYCIPYNKYYILNLVIKSSTKNSSKDNKSNLHILAKKYLSRNLDHQPLVVYIFKNNISLIFSCSEENKQHYKNGSHHKIISEYVSIMSRDLKTDVYGSIVELETRTSVATYLIWKVHSNSLKYIIDSSNGTISTIDTTNKTLSELKEDLQNIDIILDDVPSQDKYGIFYKLKKKKTEVVIDFLSEFLDSRDIKKYINFIFY
jgi:hypothetical protein